MQTQLLTSELDGTASETSRPIPWWAKLSALIALFNLALVLFNISYIPLRDFYLRQLPGVVTLYDPVKGIEPHPVTVKYLNTVDQLSTQLSQPSQPEAQTQQLLEDLRNQSATIIDENPFLVPAKVGTFAQIKRRMAEHLGTTSAKGAFQRFWSSEYLSQADSQAQLGFFNNQIRPLMEANYFRQVDSYGRFIDNFWRIDLVFIAFFAAEYLIRTFLLSRRFPRLSWGDCMVRRWYDVFLFLPLFRPLRAMPVLVRLHQSGVINFDRAIVQITYEPMANLANQVTNFVIVRIITQTQNAIKNGDAAGFLLNTQPYITVNNIDEVEAISDRLLHLTVNRVLPKVQPGLENLMRHSIENSFKQSDFYQGLKRIPALGMLPAEVIDQLANYLAGATVDVVSSSYSDTKGRQILDKLTTDFKEALRQELKDKETLSELQSLLNDWLEELKLNYVVRSTKNEAEETLAEMEILSQVADRSGESAEAVGENPAVAAADRMLGDTEREVTGQRQEK
ncbi:hypothetical protein [Microcoleus sp. FACHB-672]|uniref:hypothetical protein n=1 Tax=Microcoleus sp. FACHB-672 TaxID=2692825 RepID=UPI0016832CCF|nr:hypothetical protein [Microcoleus sp. FACHB-672]MBD2041522.1 hypothetical protein [Microcoleus sp. FACHB-672]